MVCTMSTSPFIPTFFEKTIFNGCIMYHYMLVPQFVSSVLNHWPLRLPTFCHYTWCCGELPSPEIWTCIPDHFQITATSGVVMSGKVTFSRPWNIMPSYLPKGSSSVQQGGCAPLFLCKPSEKTRFSKEALSACLWTQSPSALGETCPEVGGERHP